MTLPCSEIMQIWMTRGFTIQPRTDRISVIKKIVYLYVNIYDKGHKSQLTTVETYSVQKIWVTVNIFLSGFSCNTFCMLLYSAIILLRWNINQCTPPVFLQRATHVRSNLEVMIDVVSHFIPLYVMFPVGPSGNLIAYL